MELRTEPSEMDWTPAQKALMRQALGLAARGVGQTSPNPMVGALVVKEGRVLGRGYHVFRKRWHAEVLALDEAGKEAAGADLFVTLEPCCHYGRTGPCTERILASGVRRVFVAAVDPNPLVAGKGLERLRQGGLDVRLGLLREAAERLNRGFFHFIRSRRPYVTLKLGMSLDGRIAVADGASRWITGEKARRDVQFLRYSSDAILVGIGTVVLDDPSLDVRWRRPKSILKTVLDGKLRCPASARLFGSGDPVLLFSGPEPGLKRRATLEGRAALCVVPEVEGLLDWGSVLDELGRRDVVHLLVEGGSAVAASLIRAGLVNRFRFYLAPLLLGGDAIPGVGPLGLSSLAHAPALGEFRLRRVGRDIAVEVEPVLRTRGDVG